MKYVQSYNNFHVSKKLTINNNQFINKLKSCIYLNTYKKQVRVLSYMAKVFNLAFR